ncbi:MULTISPECIES: hypothetical protein [unclassified Pseudarthrobacter]|uniref:hypothetical protein n=1 Tax=unclassified Pseudarthrobacter TaxID=2647000 RepID=UPI0030768F70
MGDHRGGVFFAPKEIEFDAGGHLEGIGRVTLNAESQGEKTRMDIEWRVRPTQGCMNFLSWGGC